MKIHRINEDLDWETYSQLADLLVEAFGGKKVTYQEFVELLYKREKQGNYTYVLEFAGIVLATGSLLVEQKLIKGGLPVGHIEDVAVLSKYKKLGYGKKIVDHLVDTCSKLGCRKIILDCSNQNMTFYNKCGFYKKDNQMRMDIL